MDENPAGTNSKHVWWIVGLCLVSAWCLYLYLYGPSRTLAPPALEGTAMAQPADYDWAPTDLSGRPAPFDQFRGKPVFLNIWATWCPPCVAELPSIAKLAGKTQLEGVAFVCVSIDQDAGTVRRFVEGKGWPMTILHVDPGSLPDVFTTQGIPATFLISPDGRIAASAIGSAEWDDHSVVTFLEKLSSVKPGASASPETVPEPEQVPEPKPKPEQVPEPDREPSATAEAR